MMFHDLTILLDWFKANQLSLNLNKTTLMHFWPGKRKLIISIDNIAIPQVTSCKFLGVYIDQNMLWNTQDYLRKVYFAHIHSHLVYGLKVWGSMLSVAQTENLFKQQKQCMCILGNWKM